jgi:adenylate cyclase class 2
MAGCAENDSAHLPILAAVALEHEIKVPVASLAAVRARLEAAGAALRERETFEENWVLDDRDGSVRGRGCLLRVRRWGARSYLTFKGAARFAGGVKTREELETEVADPEVVLQVLAALGFMSLRRYQKHREAWALAGVAVTLDRTPMGDFVELEGPPAAIGEAAAALAIDPASAVPGSYLALWEAYRAAHPGAPADMVFAQDPPLPAPE